MSKLVRDRIPEIINAEEGRTAIIDVVEGGEFYSLLVDKVEEEFDEFLGAQDPEELADLLEVLHGLARHCGFQWDDIEIKRQEKFAARGGFYNGIVLERVAEL